MAKAGSLDQPPRVGDGEAAAMSITGHVDPNVFKRHNVRRDAVQAEARHAATPTSLPSAL
jgi:hypothetical protein